MNSVTCKMCGKQGLKWRTVNGHWRLSDRTGAHVCAEYTQKRDSGELNNPSTLEEAIIIIRRLERANKMLLASIEEYGEQDET